jgi:hypothetical protein
VVGIDRRWRGVELIEANDVGEFRAAGLENRFEIAEQQIGFFFLFRPAAIRQPLGNNIGGDTGLEVLPHQSRGENPIAGTHTARIGNAILPKFDRQDRRWLFGALGIIG